jgi:hypothetical protein
MTKSLPSLKWQAFGITSGSQAIIALDERRRSYGFASPPFDGFALIYFVIDMSSRFSFSDYFAALLGLSHSVFIHLIAVNGGVYGKGAVFFKVIPFTVDLQPLAGQYDSIRGEVIALFIASAADGLPAG